MSRTIDVPSFFGGSTGRARTEERHALFRHVPGRFVPPCSGTSWEDSRIEMVVRAYRRGSCIPGGFVLTGGFRAGYRGGSCLPGGFVQARTGGAASSKPPRKEFTGGGGSLRTGHRRHICTFVCTHICIHTYTAYIHISICVYIHIYTYIYIYIYVPISVLIL